MNKGFWKSLIVVLAGYGIFAYLISSNWGTYKHMPLLVLVGSLSIFFILGSLLHKDLHKVGMLVGIFLPHIIGDILYVVALNIKSGELVKTFRLMLPHMYMNADRIQLDVLPSTKIMMVTAIIIPLSFFAVLLGAAWRKNTKVATKWLYNNSLVWGVHFVIFTILTNLATRYPRIFSEQRAMMIFAIIATVILFVAYFFAGRACHTIKNQVGQVTSMVSVSLTAIIFYIGTLLAMSEAGIFERYILPVATSFIGIICKQIGIMTGANAKVISQYGILATSIMVLIPLVFFYVGKRVSLEKEKTNWK